VVAFRIIDRLRKQNNLSAPVETLEELYPRLLLAAAVVLGLGSCSSASRSSSSGTAWVSQPPAPCC
jgi:hypothetical protein